MKKIQTDNASIYSGKEFKQTVADLGIQHTQTKPSAPAENGRVERFFRLTEADFLKQRQDWKDRGNKPLSLDAFKQELKKSIDDYNSRLYAGRRLTRLCQPTAPIRTRGAKHCKAGSRPCVNRYCSKFEVPKAK